MGVALRVTLPDRPGALARVASAVADAGADVLSVTVLAAEQGRAVDDFRLRWPDGRDLTPLTDAVSRCVGVEVLGCRRTRWLIDGRPDLDLLSYLMSVPERGVETLVDMAPAALDADWAELRAPAPAMAALYSSCSQPHDDLAPDCMPVRAQAFGDSSGRSWAILPIPALRSVIVLGRDEGPPFLRAELTNAERVISLATLTVQTLLHKTDLSSVATDLTAHLDVAGR